MSKDTWKVFEYIRNNPQPELEIAVNTNLVVEEKLIERFISEVNSLKDAVKRVDVYTSLESVGAQAEYSRFGLDYDYWIRNIRACLERTESTVSVMTTINILSLSSLPEFIELIMQLRCDYNKSLEVNRIPLSINYLRWPAHLSVKLLPKNIRNDCSQSILKTSEAWLKYYRKHQFARLYLEEWDQIKRFCDYLNIDEDLAQKRKNFVGYIREYDRRRGTDFASVFPELAHLLEEWNA